MGVFVVRLVRLMQLRFNHETPFSCATAVWRETSLLHYLPVLMHRRENLQSIKMLDLFIVSRSAFLA